MSNHVSNHGSHTKYSALAWLVLGWSIGGVVLLLAQAIVRLWAPAMRVFEGDLTAGHWVLVGIWTMFMLYTEAWRGFHKQFCPRVVVRALRLARFDGAPSPWALVAPLVAMGLVHATPRRLRISRILVLGIVCLVLAVRWLPHPWRAIVDVGVVLGLLGGLLSLFWHVARVWLRGPPQVPDEFPA